MTRPDGAGLPAVASDGWVVPGLATLIKGLRTAFTRT